MLIDDARMHTLYLDGDGPYLQWRTPPMFCGNNEGMVIFS